jgi:hypothetical protein
MSITVPRNAPRSRPRTGSAEAGAGALSRAQLGEREAVLLRVRERMERALWIDDGARQAATTRGLSLQAPPNDGGGFDVALEARVHGRYEAVVDALERMTAGSYGTCLTCQQPVPYGRLIVMPEARHCMACGPRA